MEYVHGESLSVLMSLAHACNERIPMGVAIALISGTLRGLHAVHEARDERGVPLGLIHRDVSPQNMLCCVDGLPRLGDFGLAKGAGEVLHTARGEFKGKLSYAAPEQLDLLSLTPATDIYAAGLILWELLAGRRLYAGLTPSQIVASALRGGVPPPSRYCPEVPPALDAVVKRALQYEASNRFHSALAMASAIEACVPAASLAEVSRWVRRLGADRLATRERLVTAAERQTTPSQRASEPRKRIVEGRNPGHALALLPMQRRRGKSIQPLGLVAGMVVAFAAINSALPRHETGRASVSAQTLAPKATVRNSLARTPSATQAPAPPASAALSLSAPPAAALAKSEATVPRAPSTPKSRARRPPLATEVQTQEAASPPRCSPPFSFDAQGIRFMKPGCQ